MSSELSIVCTRTSKSPKTNGVEATISDERDTLSASDPPLAVLPPKNEEARLASPPADLLSSPISGESVTATVYSLGILNAMTIPKTTPIITDHSKALRAAISLRKYPIQSISTSSFSEEFNSGLLYDSFSDINSFL